MRTLKATREQLKRHNRQLLLRAIYSGLADNRASLAQETGLAKPTVSDLIAEMIEEGFLVESGRGESTDSGGKRPTLLRFVPDARQVIGVSLEGRRIFGVLVNLAGQVTAEHYVDLQELSGENVIILLQQAINGLVAQLDAPLLCIGVGVPGIVHDGMVRQAESLGWHNVALPQLLYREYSVPVYPGNCAELTALAQFAFGLANGDQPRSLATIQVDETVTVGVTLDRVTYHHGADLSGMRVPQPDGSFRRMDSILGWSAVEQRIKDLARVYPATQLPVEGLTYMHLRYGAANGDPIALRIYDELSTALAQIFTWVISILRPDHIALTGATAVLGERFLNTIIQKLNVQMAGEDLQTVAFSLAYSDNLSAIGAAALALQRELGTL
jgi:N-acetylglucosamine repressor